MSNEIRVFLDEDFTRRAEIELGGMIAKIFPVDSGPDEAAISIDIDLGHAQFRGRKIFLFVHTPGGRIKLAARCINALDLFHRHTGASVHHDRQARNQFLDFFDHLEVKTLLALEFVGAVAGADRSRERIATGPLDELNCFLADW